MRAPAGDRHRRYLTGTAHALVQREIGGETDGEGGQVVRNEYYSDDIAMTVYKKLGIPHDLVVRAPDGRPVQLIEGKPIREWL